MKVKIKKSRLEQIIKEEYDRHKRYSAGEDDAGSILRDEVQTAMMDAALEVLEARGVDPKTIQRAELELEDKLVLAMTDMDLGLGGVNTMNPDLEEDAMMSGIFETIKEVDGEGEPAGGNYSTGTGGGEDQHHE
jgi:hypothetical protein